MQERLYPDEGGRTLFPEDIRKKMADIPERTAKNRIRRIEPVQYRPARKASLTSIYRLANTGDGGMPQSAKSPAPHSIVVFGMCFDILETPEMDSVPNASRRLSASSKSMPCIRRWPIRSTAAAEKDPRPHATQRTPRCNMPE